MTCDGRAAVVGPLVVPGTGAVLALPRPHRPRPRLDRGPCTRQPPRLDRVALPPGGLGVLTAAVTATVVLAAIAGATRLAGVSTEIEVDGPERGAPALGRHPLCTAVLPRGGAVTGPAEVRTQWRGE